MLSILIDLHGIADRVLIQILNRPRQPTILFIDKPDGVSLASLLTQDELLDGLHLFRDSVQSFFFLITDGVLLSGLLRHGRLAQALFLDNVIRRSGSVGDALARMELG